MKLHILFKFVEGPYGGGNQFLKALREQLQSQGRYTEVPDHADAFLWNGYPFPRYDTVWQLHDTRVKCPSKPIIMRLDGPVWTVRGKDRFYDVLLKRIADVYVDGIVYQSAWTRDNNKRLTGIAVPFETIIYNAPNPAIFNRIGRERWLPSRKPRLIATSWSANWRKGFRIYQWMDRHLNWDRYEMTFVGNSPIKFANIRMIPPLPSAELANILKRHDIYITASYPDPCSNALIEALSCGLPAVAYNGGGHPELVGSGGLLFDRPEHIPQLVERIVAQYDEFRSSLPLFDITKVADQYHAFAEQISASVANRRWTPVDVQRFRRRCAGLQRYFVFHHTRSRIRERLRLIWRKISARG
jgi:glycosyltransferase involved in cell wall biosynthesis